MAWKAPIQAAERGIDHGPASRQSSWITAGRRWPAVGLAILLIPGLLSLGGLGCECDDDCSCVRPDLTAPAAPRGLYSITGDGAITLVWLANTEEDLEGYEVWWSDAYDGEYEYIATLLPSGGYEERYVDTGAVNGDTYYYGITAYDRAGNSSELSLEEVWDTPRPVGFAVTIANALDRSQVAYAGFDLWPPAVVSAEDSNADFHYQYLSDEQQSYLVTEHWEGTGNRVQAQDMGMTNDFDEISFAPTSGWSPTGILEAIAGHTYVFLTWRGGSQYYAKVRVLSVGPDHMTFDWAYQTAPGNIQLDVP